MSENTMHLAQLIGPILLLLGVSFGLNKNFYLGWFKKMEKEASFLFLAGLVEATAGLAIVLSHNLWSSPAEIIISFLGWAMIAEGSICLLLNTKFPQGVVNHMIKSMPQFLTVSAIVMLAAGGYLSYLAYMM